MPDTADTGPVLGRPLRSVRVRITLAAVVVTAVAMTAAGWLLVRSVEDTQLGRVRDDTGAYLEEVTDRLEAGEDPWAAVAPTGTADTTTRPPPFVQVMDDQGHTLAVHPTLPRGSGDATVALSLSADGAGTGAIIKSGTSSGAAAPPEGATGAGGAGAAGEPVGPDEAALETGIMLVRAEDGEPIERIVRQVDTPSGAMTVYAAAPVDEVQGSVDAVRRALWTWLPVLVAVVALVAWHLVGRALRPVEAIRSEVAAIGGATMHRRVPAPDTDDEIGRLAHTMNAMLGRLEASATRQRQFVSDASHELRSPVAAIRTDLEVALREGPDADWAVVASSVLAEEARLERLLDDLLVLAASDESAVAATDGPVDLAALLADDAAPGAPGRGAVRCAGGRIGARARRGAGPGRRQPGGQRRPPRPDAGRALAPGGPAALGSARRPGPGRRRRARHRPRRPRAGVRTLHPPRRGAGPRRWRGRPRPGRGPVDRRPPRGSGVGDRRPAGWRPHRRRAARRRLTGG